MLWLTHVLLALQISFHTSEWRCLTDIALPDWLNVEVLLEDQSFDSFDEAMVLWLDYHLPNDSFYNVKVSGCFTIYLNHFRCGNGLWSPP